MWSLCKKYASLLDQVTMESEHHIETLETSVEMLTAVSEEDINQLLKLEAEMFNDGEWFDELEGFKEELSRETSCLSVLRNTNSQIVGFALGVPALNMVDKLRNVDPAYQVDESMLYIVSIAILPQYRGRSNLDKLIALLMKKANERGCKIISAHVPHRHVPAYQRLFKVEDIRSVDEWDGAHIPHHYIEFPLGAVEDTNTK